MSKEKYNQIIDEVYENYSKEYEKDNSIGMCLLVARMDGKKTYRKPNKEMFVGLCTHDKTFSETWGLKIEERELSFNHRYRLGGYQPYNIECKVEYEKGLDYITQEQFETFHNKEMDKLNIPTKLITLTYNEQTIESYE